jgi:REP element-mobilizing transposase RayT
MDLRQRKPMRLSDYDYSLNGAYFVTICAQDRASLFGNFVGASINRPCFPVVQLSKYGLIANEGIQMISEHYADVSVDKYVIMPNHIHMILILHHTAVESGRLIIAPTSVSRIVKQFKRYSSKAAGISLWQRSFHDRIIRDETEYKEIWQYIDNNPASWAEDRYFTVNI